MFQHINVFIIPAPPWEAYSTAIWIDLVDNSVSALIFFNALLPGYLKLSTFLGSDAADQEPKTKTS